MRKSRLFMDVLFICLFTYMLINSFGNEEVNWLFVVLAITAIILNLYDIIKNYIKK